MTVASPLLDRPGAVPAEPPDGGVAWHYGDPLLEQRRLASGDGSVDLSHWGVVRVSGAARLTWLNDLTSQELRFLPAGGSTETLVLDPQGHVEQHLRVVDDGSATWLVTPPGAAGASLAALLAAYLLRMRFWTEVDIEDVSDAYASVWQPVAAPVSGRPTWVSSAGSPMPGRLVLVPRTKLETYVAGPLAGTWAFEALRVAAGMARLGVDTDDRTIPHELGWIGTAVALDKGCYRGQETVARVHNLGRPPRRLVLLHLDGSAAALPAPGDAVTAESQPVGRLGTVVQHYELGPSALALVRRAVPLALPLEAGGVAAAQEEPTLLSQAPAGGAGREAQRGLRPTSAPRQSP